MNRFRKKLYRIIFHADTQAGKLFDVVLLIAILVAMLAVMLESVNYIGEKYGGLLHSVEWIITIVFTLEYILRIAIHPRPKYYVLSFYGIIDLLSALPTYVALFFTGTHYLAAIRALRLLRVFRILKLSKYVSAGSIISRALMQSKAKIGVFIYFVLIVVIVVGTLMYFVEGVENGFTSIPRSIYWAIVTLTTVGYGDISPQTDLGQFISSIIMIMGYSVLAVPTGIVSAEMTKIKTEATICNHCKRFIDASEPVYCPHCGEKLLSDL